MVQRIRSILSACNMQFQTRNLVNRVSYEYIAQYKLPLVDEHAFPLTEFAVA